jgi:Zn-dependent alcohol dehydrogenase
MAFQYRAAVLHAPQTPLSVETVTAASLKPTDLPVRMINDGFAALKQGKTIRSAIALD